MRVRISYTIEIDDDARRAINLHYGRDGIASRDEVQNWYRSFGESMDDDFESILNSENWRPEDEEA